MTQEIRAAPLTLTIERRAEDDKAPVLIGHAAVFNSRSEDLGGFVEVIEPGAFARSLDADIRALFNHDTNIVLGRTRSNSLTLGEDGKGLRVEILPPDTQLVRDMVITPIERGDISQMSFGFRVRAGGSRFEEDEDGTIVRILTDLELFEVSPVTFPAYPETDVAVREFRSFVREKQKERKFNPTAHAMRMKQRMLERGLTR